MNTIEKVLYTGKTHTTATRRDGATRVRPGALDVHLSSGDIEEQFTAVAPHPTAERWFAGAWSACYSAALGVVAAQKKVKLPQDLAVDIEVDLGQTGDAWLLQARLKVHAPGLDKDLAEQLALGAHEICPYSKATRGNIDVSLTVTT
jgi:osmotically inducible protein OsmC